MIPAFYKWTKLQQDSSQIHVRKDTVSHKNTTGQDTTLKRKQETLSLDAIENIFSRGEQRLKKIDSVEVKKQRLKQITQKEKPVVKTNLPDTVQLLSLIKNVPDNSGRVLGERITSHEPVFFTSTSVILRPVEKKNVPLIGKTVQAEKKPSVIERNPAFLRENWFIGALILSFLLIIWTKIRFGKLFNETITGMWNYKNSFSLLRNRSSLYHQTSLLLFINYLISGGLFLYLSLKAFNISSGYHLSHFSIYLIILLVLAALYIYLYIVIRLTGYFTISRDAMSEYLHFTNLFFHNAGIYLFPVNALIPYIYEGAAQWLLYAGWFLIGGLYILRIIKLITIFIRERFSLFLLFLYLCALEILPILIFIHLLIR